MSDHYMSAEEFCDALADTSHTMVGSIEGTDMGGKRERITRIELQLSNGRVIEIVAEHDLDGYNELLLSEIDS